MVRVSFKCSQTQVRIRHQSQQDQQTQVRHHHGGPLCVKVIILSSCQSLDGRLSSCFNLTNPTEINQPSVHAGKKVLTPAFLHISAYISASHRKFLLRRESVTVNYCVRPKVTFRKTGTLKWRECAFCGSTIRFNVQHFFFTQGAINFGAYVLHSTSCTQSPWHIRGLLFDQLVNNMWKLISNILETFKAQQKRSKVEQKEVNGGKRLDTV